MTQVSGNGHKRAVLYARVSSDDQAETGYSLPSQLDLCRKYAERLGFEIVAELREDISGAMPIAERPQGQKLTAILNVRQADAVIAYQVDRLSRDIVDLLASVRNWLRAGVEVHACDVGKVESELDIVLVIKGWQGSDERKKIIERCSRGTHTKARSGKVVGGGRALYGYRFLRNANNKVVGLEIHKVEARVVRLVYRWYVNGDERGRRLSIYGIVRKLSAMRVPTPGESRKYNRKRESGLWTESQVSSILRNETYAGTWRFGKLMGHAGKRGKRALSDQIAISVPAIVEHELWETAQCQREHNRKMAKRNAKRDYLLSSMIRCGCGLAMTGKFTDRPYYVCSRYSHYLPRLETQPCNQKYVRADLIEQIVWDYVRGLFSDLERFKKGLLLAQQTELGELAPKRDELATIEKLIADTENEAANYARALANSPSKVVERALEQQAREVDARYNALSQRHDELKAVLEARRLNDEAVDAALDFRERIVVGLEEATFDDKREMLDKLGVEVIIKGGQAQISCRIPTQPPKQLSIKPFVV